ncbi:hypothetical protein BU23DRAFT_283567 [Bimuria novae-zelandiae CBS 107.79]|uniref:Uncharacterized protein n=1 Tax=Bimuria novae-zelandiae CBS 107.79 TaxID=1447943 RepID=A0A6A5USR0_9PLEO|nr:hypothetical protein BU23DRAFT_283567 [Bimuria novae-zelandiae CBS 107.79]
MAQPIVKRQRRATIKRNRARRSAQTVGCRSSRRRAARSVFKLGPGALECHVSVVVSATALAKSIEHPKNFTAISPLCAVLPWNCNDKTISPMAFILASKTTATALSMRLGTMFGAANPCCVQHQAIRQAGYRNALELATFQESKGY